MTNDSCSNCGLTGHAKNNCPRPKGFKLTSSSGSKGKEAAGSAKVAVRKVEPPGMSAGEDGDFLNGGGPSGSVGGGGGFSCDGGGDAGGICFDFTKGKCTRGDACRFSHDAALATSALAASKGGVCFDYTKGLCNRGDSCRFSHEIPAAGTQVKSSGICFDFTRGLCTRGDSCRFSHDMNAARSSQAAASSRGICFDYAKGRCSRGPACRFSHDMSQAEGGGSGMMIRPVAVPVTSGGSRSAPPAAVGGGGGGGGGAGAVCVPCAVQALPGTNELQGGPGAGSSYAGAAARVGMGSSYASISKANLPPGATGGGGYDSQFPAAPGSAAVRAAPAPATAGGGGWAAVAAAGGGIPGSGGVPRRNPGGGAHGGAMYGHPSPAGDTHGPGPNNGWGGTVAGAAAMPPRMAPHMQYGSGGMDMLSAGIAGMALGSGGGGSGGFGNGFGEGYGNDYGDNEDLDTRGVESLVGGPNGAWMKHQQQPVEFTGMPSTYSDAGMAAPGGASHPIDPGLVSELIKMAPWLVPADGVVGAGGAGGPATTGSGAWGVGGSINGTSALMGSYVAVSQGAMYGGHPMMSGAVGGGTGSGGMLGAGQMGAYGQQLGEYGQQAQPIGGFRAGALLAKAYGGEAAASGPLGMGQYSDGQYANGGVADPLEGEPYVDYSGFGNGF